MKILVVLSRPPYPLDKGDKLRAFYQLREIAKENRVYLFCLNNKPLHTKTMEVLSQFVDDVHVSTFNMFDSFKGMLKALITGKPFQYGYYTHSKNIKEFYDYARIINPDVTFNQFVRTSRYTVDNAAKVLDFQDALSTNMDRRASKSFFLKRIVYKIEAIRLRRMERQMFNKFDKLTIIVDEDRKEIRSPRNAEIEILANGVDESYFEYKKDYDKEFDIIFSGGMSYEPNVVAAEYLVDVIMPKVWAKRPNTNLVLAGSSPTKKVRKLAGEKVIVTGWVDDMKEYYAKSRVFIAPMLIGTGLQNKLLEAMAMNLPCITSKLAGDALRAEDGKEILIGNSAKEFAAHIINLLDNEDLSKSIAKEGNRFVEENYNWQVFGQKLEEILKEAISIRGS